ncbi:MAG TPA: NUDIX domain-containing protein [Candidatus Baltobacteraceae bacterium]|jgi:8-oxo-dGTP diphosphatase|nr:NUDIX domain-containing protein [Candidatus Baltobacteraceae bacterium]
MPEKPFSLAVRAVVRDENGNCLLVRRSRNSRLFAGQWEWPGGKVEPGEDFVTALTRELREETSLIVEITGLAGAAQYELPMVHVVSLFMEVRLLGGEVRLSEEHEMFAWAPLAGLAEWELAEQARDFMIRYAAAANRERLSSSKQ